MKKLRGLWNYGLTRCNFADEGDNGGDDGGGGAGADTKKVTPKKVTPKEETFVVTVDGQDQTMTKEEVLKLASEAGGAQRKFSEAAEMRKQATKGLRVSELVETVNDGSASVEEAKELAVLLNLESDAFLGEPEVDDKKKDTKPAEKHIITKADLDPELQRQLDYLQGIGSVSEKMQIQSARKEIEETCQKAVTDDEVIGKILDEMDEDNRDDVVSVLSDLVLKDIRGRIFAGDSYGPKLIDNAIREVRTSIKKLGIPAKASREPISVGLGLPGSIPEEVYSNEPIKRVASTDDGYEENVIARTMQNIRQVLHGKKR